MLRDEGVELGVRAAGLLAGLGVRIGPGLSESEFGRIEEQYGVEFADDHRTLLAAGLPLNTPNPVVEGVCHSHAEPWPDWRGGDPESLRKALRWPVEGVLFDVEHQPWFWPGEWGTRPGEVSDAVEIARERLAVVPQMVPVYGHRYLPPGRGTYGHPVLSMYQTDIVSYGSDLAEYVVKEFGGAELQEGVDGTGGGELRLTVPFWSELM